MLVNSLLVLAHHIGSIFCNHLVWMPQWVFNLLLPYRAILYCLISSDDIARVLTMNSVDEGLLIYLAHHFYPDIMSMMMVDVAKNLSTFKL